MCFPGYKLEKNESPGIETNEQKKLSNNFRSYGGSRDALSFILYD